MKKYIDLAAISVGGETVAFFVRDINAYLEMIVLLVTIGGLIWRTFKKQKTK